MNRLKLLAVIVTCFALFSSAELSFGEESMLSNQAGEMNRCDALLQSCIDICQIIDPKSQSQYCLLICEVAYNACLNPNPQPPISKPLPGNFPKPQPNIS